MKHKIKKIVEEYHKNLTEEGGYDDETMMRSHYTGIMNSLMSSGALIYDEYTKLGTIVLPEIMDDKTKNGLIKSLNKLEEFLQEYSKFINSTHDKNVKRFKKGDE